MMLKSDNPVENLYIESTFVVRPILIFGPLVLLDVLVQGYLQHLVPFSQVFGVYDY